MGDTGSLALGAVLAVVSLQSQQWILLPIVGVIFVIEALSVIIQTSYFKWTKKRFGEGRRIFKMAPLHHHFELIGWSQTQVTQRFALVGVVAAMIGISMALTFAAEKPVLEIAPAPTPLSPDVRADIGH
jgi:phospho-N-acetylmuramoyl-pentapeptide-transferase